MIKILNKIRVIFDKIFYVIKKYILPFCIALLLFIYVMQFFGFDTLSFKLMQIIGLDEGSYELTQMIAVCAAAWILYDILGKSLIEQDDLRDEYREYLIRELEEDIIGDSSRYKSEKSERTDSDGNEESYVSNTIIEQRKADKKDIIALMLKNNDEITEYFKISKNQAKASFWFSVISCIVGMGALGIGIYGIVVLKDISISVISLISGSISELISGTVFWVHNKSALQLNHYYGALHENEKFLSAVNIADKLSIEKREEVLIEIIHKQINSETSKIETEKTKETEKSEN